ncbi:hypothetical protein [Deinococcus marmoris]|uniref:hypothetical protein n=1 Tax=Deinococcus marmoris TaxID=249408 RepID=UPI00049553B9|nr:hypothetical protein [Deinococcus marmoris]
MTRSDAVLAIICAGPDRSWTPAQVSAALGWPPEFARNAMKFLYVQGELLRSEPGCYHLPTWTPPTSGTCKPRPSRAGQGISTLPRDLPPLTPPAHPPDPALMVLVINTLHAHGRPMSQTMLINRLSGCGLKLAALQAILAALELAGEVQRTPERLHELTSQVTQ